MNKKIAFLVITVTLIAFMYGCYGGDPTPPAPIPTPPIPVPSPTPPYPVPVPTPAPSTTIEDGYGILKGRVCNYDTGKAVYDVRVSADTGESTYTNYDGYFTFSKITAGKRRISLYKSGYESTYFYVNKIVKDQTATLTNTQYIEQEKITLTLRAYNSRDDKIYVDKIIVEKCYDYSYIYNNYWYEKPYYNDYREIELTLISGEEYNIYVYWSDDKNYTEKYYKTDYSHIKELTYEDDAW